MSRTKRTSTTKRTSKLLTQAERKAWFTTWQTSDGVRHYALAKHEDKDTYTCDVFIPCEGYIGGALNNTGTEMIVTCVQCLSSTFKLQCSYMNKDEIDHLDDSDVLDYFLDHEALASGYNPFL